MNRGVLCLVALLVAGCDEEESKVRRDAPVAGSQTDAAADSWLALGDETPPEVWLASQAAGRALDGADPSVDDYRRLLADAAGRFNETPRMIANRTVQLEAMLAEHRIDEDARLIISGFLASSGSGARRSDYGALCQHYFNLRTTGVDRQAALTVLGGTSPAEP